MYRSQMLNEFLDSWLLESLSKLVSLLYFDLMVESVSANQSVKDSIQIANVQTVERSNVMIF